MAVCTVAGDQRAPVIVSDAAGGAIVGWVDYRSTYEPHIYARLVSGAGVPQWAADGVALCSAPGGQSGPALVTDGAGGAIAAWLDDRDGLASDIYAQRVSGAGSPLWPTDGVALCDTTDFRDSPALVPDGAGGAIAAWSDYRSGYGDIYERRVTAGGATPSGDAVTSASKDQLLPALVADGAGGAIVVWQDYRSNADYDVYAQHLTGPGSVDVPARPAPGGLWLDGAAPNPVRERTMFRFGLAPSQRVSIAIYDLAGRRVRQLVDGLLPAGEGSASWDGRDDSGNLAPNAVYFCRLDCALGSLGTKLVKMR